MMTYDECRRLFKYNPKTGVITWTKSRIGTNVAGYVHKRDGYRWIWTGAYGGRHRAAYIAALWMTGEWPASGMDVDHMNGDRDDDRWSNLRVVTRAENTHYDDTKGVTGVRERQPYSNGRPCWVAQITVDGKDICLYQGSSFEEAVICRKDSEIEYGFHENHSKSGNI